MTQSNGALPTFFILELILSASLTAEAMGEKNQKESGALRDCRYLAHPSTDNSAANGNPVCC